MIKKLVFFLVLSIVSISCFSQTDTVTLPNGQRLIPKNPNNYPSAVYNDSLKVITHNAVVNGKRVNLQLRAGDIKDAAIASLNSSSSVKDKVVAERSYPIGFNNDFSSKTIAQVTGNLATSPNYQTDGWYKFSFYTYKSGSVLNSLNDYSSTESLSITGLPANSGSNTPLYFTTTTPQNFNGSTAMRNGDYLMLLVINRQMVTWYTGTNDLATKKAIEMIRDSLSAKASAAEVALKAPQTALDSEAATRIAESAQKWGVSGNSNLANSWIGHTGKQNFVVKTNGIERMRIDSASGMMAIGKTVGFKPETFVHVKDTSASILIERTSANGAAAANFHFRRALGEGGAVTANTLLGAVNYFGWSSDGFWRNPVVEKVVTRNDFVPSGYAARKTWTFNLPNVGTLVDRITMQYEGIGIGTTSPTALLHLSGSANDGIRFTDSTLQVTAAITKSKTLTLTTGSTPALDFEKCFSSTYVLTTALAGNFFPTATMTNIKDGGRYAIRFIAVHTGNVFTFPSNVYKKDGTAFGAYAVISEILDFIAIGSDLYCVNK